MISFYDWAAKPEPRGGGGGADGRNVDADREAQSNPEVQGKICEKIQNAVDISDVFNKVAIHRSKASPKTLVFAAHRIARYCRLRRQDTASTRRAARWTSLIGDLQRGLRELDAQSLTDTAWSLAVVGHRDNRLLSALCHEIHGRVEEMAPANLAITAWSFATLNYRDDQVMKRVNRQALARLSEFESQSLANLAWSLATMRLKDDVLMHHISKAVLERVDTFSAQHVANTAWAYATLARRSAPVFRALERRAVTLLRDETVDFVPLDLALCSWAYAWLAHAGPEAPLLRGITEAASRRLRDFSSQQLANMLWGLDHSNYKDDAFYVQVARWCCQLPRSFWTQAAGEEMVSILTALKPYGEQERGWKDLEALFESIVLEPLAKFLSQENSSEGYAQGLRQLRVYHAGTLYTERLLQRLGITYLGNGDDPRTRAKMEDLLQFYLLPPEPRWLPDGYDDDDIQANRAEIPSLLELLDVKRRCQPSSHFLALHLSALLEVRVRKADGSPSDEVRQVKIWRTVPTRPPRKSGLTFVRGEKFEERDLSGDEEGGGLRTSTLRDYRRKHHAEVAALTQVADAIEALAEEGNSSSSSMPCQRMPKAAAPHSVSGWVEFFGTHYPCSSCTGAIVQFMAMYPRIQVRVGHDDWRHWVRRLSDRWDQSDERHHLLSINARQMRELDRELNEPLTMV